MTNADVSFWIAASQWSQTQVAALHVDAHPPQFNDGDEISFDWAGRHSAIPLPTGAPGLTDGERARIKLEHSDKLSIFKL